MMTLTYQLQWTTPLHIGVGYGFAGFLDSIVVRDRQDQFYVPGSSIKGKARAGARRLAHAFGFPLCPAGTPCGLTQNAPCPVCSVFGSPQFPGQFYFDNLTLPTAYRQLLQTLAQSDRLAARQMLTDRRTGVMLSRQRRAANPDFLFTNELVQPGLSLAGQIMGPTTLTTSSLLPTPLVLLWAALESVTHLGRARSRGLGSCTLRVETLHSATQTFTREHYSQTLQALASVNQ